MIAYPPLSRQTKLRRLSRSEPEQLASCGLTVLCPQRPASTDFLSRAQVRGALLSDSHRAVEPGGRAQAVGYLLDNLDGSAQFRCLVEATQDSCYGH